MNLMDRFFVSVAGANSPVDVRSVVPGLTVRSLVYPLYQPPVGWQMSTDVADGRCWLADLTLALSRQARGNLLTSIVLNTALTNCIAQIALNTTLSVSW